MSFSNRSYGTIGNRTLSMYGGAGGQGSRISTSRHGSLYGSVRGFNFADGLDLQISTNEKATMQNLNDRLASYMQKVQSLEKKNAELERKISEFYECNTVVFRDHSDFLATIKDLRHQIEYLSKYNIKTILDIDNARLTADDFRIKYEAEQSMRMPVETDTNCYRKALDELTVTHSDLEMQYESLKEELVMLEKIHEEEMAQMREQAGQVNVRVDAAPSVDLNQTLSEIRQHYESIAAKNNSDLENWYLSKISTVQQEMVTHTEELEYSSAELKELKYIFQRLQVELQTHHSMRRSNEATLAETDAQFFDQLANLQRTIDELELKLSHIRTDMTNKKTDYDILLEITSHLETEITEYRLLLEGEDSEHQMEEMLVDGKVVEGSERAVTDE